MLPNRTRQPVEEQKLGMAAKKKEKKKKNGLKVNQMMLDEHFKPLKDHYKVQENTE